MQGNWTGFNQDDDGDGSMWDLEQTRAHNLANEIDTDNTHGDADTPISGGSWIQPVYDAAGNMTVGPKPGDEDDSVNYVYDAWNRLVAVKSGGVEISRNHYDGLGRRIKKVDKESEPDVEYSYYYNTSWQIVEVRKDGAANPYKQYVWDLRYIDAPVLRDRDADGNAGTGDYGKTGSGLEERLYYTNDANMNVTALLNTSGQVVERYSYDPYGRVTFRKPDFSKTDGPDGQSGTADEWSERTSNTFENNILYAGYLYDDETGLFHVRNRTYHPTLGRWLQRDPAEFDQAYCDVMVQRWGKFTGRKAERIVCTPNDARESSSESTASRSSGR